MDIERVGGGLVNVVLGALILWVAQTTFQHSGQLAGVDQKFGGIATQHDNLRDRLDNLMGQVNERTRSRFTREDGDRIAADLEEIAMFTANLERRFSDRLTQVQLKVNALETQGVDQRELRRLRTDIERLHVSLYPRDRHLSSPYPSTPTDGRYQQTPVDVARAPGANGLR